MAHLAAIARLIPFPRPHPDHDACIDARGLLTPSARFGAADSARGVRRVVPPAEVEGLVAEVVDVPLAHDGVGRFACISCPHEPRADAAFQVDRYGAASEGEDSSMERIADMTVVDGSSCPAPRPARSIDKYPLARQLEENGAWSLE